MNLNFKVQKWVLILKVIISASFLKISEQLRNFKTPSDLHFSFFLLQKQNLTVEKIVSLGVRTSSECWKMRLIQENQSHFTSSLEWFPAVNQSTKWTFRQKFLTLETSNTSKVEKWVSLLTSKMPPVFELCSISHSEILLAHFKHVLLSIEIMISRAFVTA